MSTGTRRISIGFHGGQVLALRIGEKPLAELYDALGGDGWLELDTEDGPVRVDLRQVVYVSADSAEPRVGFGQRAGAQLGMLLSGEPGLDERLARLARTRGHAAPAAERAVVSLSRLGEHGAVWFAIGLAGQALDGRRSGRWRRATRAVAATYALNTLLKLVVRRRRPELAGLPPLTSTPTALSFPSAHASTAFAGALAYSRLGVPAAPLYTLAGALSLSRLYLGVHYPSDVAAGAVLGTAVAACMTATGRESADTAGGSGAGGRATTGAPGS